ncbi:MAG: hypothetical protein JO100_04870 [Pseudonocardia sp.]|nr:hypothetical protein [Pseudonocardia sp.]
MSKRRVKVLVVVASATGLTGLASATAWADSFTPAIEEPTYELGFPQGPPLTGTAPAPSPDGNYSSAQGRDGKVYRGAEGEKKGSHPYEEPSDSDY